MSGPSEHQHCSSCKWADPAVGDDDEPRLDCRRFPPAVVGWDSDGESITQIFPQVQGDDWCGEWVWHG